MGICIASMIGAGIFIVPGEIGPLLGSPLNILVAWSIGGVLALCGGLIVAEIAAGNPQAGSVYRTVHTTLGPNWGYFFGTIAVFVGYFTSLSVVALAAADYIGHFLPSIDGRLIASVVIIIPAAIHGTRVLAGTLMNDLLVALKIGIVAVFVVAGLGTALETVPPPPDAPPPPDPVSASMGSAVVRITFAYLGWSAVNVVAGEVRKPSRTLPLAVLGSVGVVTAAYLLMNVVYMEAVDPMAMGAEGTDIGGIAARMIFGHAVGDLVTLAIIALIVSTAATMIFTGSRLVLAMSWRGELPARLGQVNRAGAPSMGVLIYAVIAMALLWSAPVGALLDYAGLLTTCCAALMAVSIVALRRRGGHRPFSMPLYPLPVIVSLGLSAWLVYSTIVEDTIIAVASVGTIAAIMLLRPWLTRPPDSTATTYTDANSRS